MYYGFLVYITIKTRKILKEKVKRLLLKQIAAVVTEQ